MFKKMLFMSMMAAPLLGVGTGCSSPESRIPASVGQDVGTVVMSLTQTAGQRTYRLTGVITPIFKANGPSQPMETGVAQPNIDLGAQDVVTAAIRVGNYDFNLNSWRMFLVTPSGQVDVSDRADHAPGETNVVNATVVAGQSVSLHYRFQVDGLVVSFDPCSTGGNVACSTQDLDGDGVLNGVECASPASCVDSDGDGTPDVSDLDSDNDGASDRDEWAVSQDGSRLNACVPNAYAAACTNPPTGAVTVDVAIEEHCGATGQDVCVFEPDAGAPPSADAGSDGGTPVVIDDAERFAYDFHQNSIRISAGQTVIATDVHVSSQVMLAFSVLSTPEVIGPTPDYYFSYSMHVAGGGENFDFGGFWDIEYATADLLSTATVTVKPGTPPGTRGYILVRVLAEPASAQGQVDALAYRTIRLIAD